jgi:hypothetical protein
MTCPELFVLNRNLNLALVSLRQLTGYKLTLMPKHSSDGCGSKLTP